MSDCDSDFEEDMMVIMCACAASIAVVSYYHTYMEDDDDDGSDDGDDKDNDDGGDKDNDDDDDVAKDDDDDDDDNENNDMAKETSQDSSVPAGTPTPACRNKHTQHYNKMAAILGNNQGVRSQSRMGDKSESITGAKIKISEWTSGLDNVNIMEPYTPKAYENVICDACGSEFSSVCIQGASQATHSSGHQDMGPTSEQLKKRNRNFGDLSMEASDITNDDHNGMEKDDDDFDNDDDDGNHMAKEPSCESCQRDAGMQWASQQSGHQDMGPSTSKQLKKRKRNFEDSLANVLSRMANAIRKLVSMKENRTEASKMKRLYEEVKKIPNVSNHFRVKACDFLLSNQAKALVFLVLDEELRLQWLLRFVNE
ncbi:uncharacterized protein LOC131245972 [Magnolia sinica]|uniref:uncharacterized protein LOC131245972 n=1 Tax=Magnolia sinica TaxID=86752 RepID=UPI002659BEC0|nr:uncharacterized protein LOC131245972 [Magnolia sinica]